MNRNKNRRKHKPKANNNIKKQKLKPKSKSQPQSKPKSRSKSDKWWDWYQEQKAEESRQKAIAEVNRKSGIVGQLTVTPALRIKKGRYQVIGQIATVSSVYNMISGINLKCPNCNTEDKIDYSKKPKYNTFDDKSSRCISCGEKGLRITPEWTSVVDVELQDSEKFNDIERLTVKLFEDNTKDVGAGETVSIVGDLDVEKKNDNRSSKFVTMLYAQHIDYTRREKIELTQSDIKDIETWKREMQTQNKDIIKALVEKFEPTVVGNEYVKQSLLLAGVNAGIPNDEQRDPKRLRINVLLVGDPSQAKSTMLRKIVAIINNARYESAQGSTGLSLTFMISKENDSHVLRLGPIPLASGSLCAINEMNQMPIEQQKHFLDFMEEGWSTNNKYGINAHITGNTSLVGTANPRSGRWRHPDTIELDEIPVLTQIIDRFDVICILRETEPDEHIDREYVNKINEIRRNNKAGLYSTYEENMKKYLMYARTFNPNADISEEASNMIDEFWIKMGQRGIKGRPRKLEGLKRIAIAISKLKLKNQVDEEDAKDAMEFYNFILFHFNQIVPVSQTPKEVAYDTFINILRESEHYPIAVKELARTACQRNEQIKDYIGEDLRIEANWKLRAIYDELLNNQHIILTSQKPAVLKWISNSESQTESMVKASKQASDVYDVSEAPGDGAAKKHEKHENMQNFAAPPYPPSYTSDTSDSEERAAKLREYDRLSALARKKSKAAAHIGVGKNDSS
jgi:DNA replicative helicase MCM subunit Mcm2 (Cdc46/Mcm family)